MFLGIDFGTSHLKGCVINDEGQVVATRSQRYDHGANGDAAATWRTSFLEISARLAESAEVEQFKSVCITGMAPNVLLQRPDGELDAILFYQDSAFELEQELDRRLSSPRWANEVLSKMISLTNKLETKRGRWFTTHNYLGWWLTGEYALDYVVASECGSIWRDGGWDGELLARFSLDQLEMPELLSPMSSLGRAVQSDAIAVLGPSCEVILGSSDSVATITGSGIKDDEILIYYGTFNSATQVRGSLESLLTQPTSEAPFDWFCSLPRSGEQLASIAGALEGDGGFDQFWADAAASPIGARGVRFVHTPWGTSSTVSTEPRGSFFNLPVDVRRSDLARSVVEAFGLSLVSFADAEGVSLEGRDAVAAGGGSQSALWRQIVSDIAGVHQYRVPDSDSALGSALLAFGGLHGYKSMRLIQDSNRDKSQATHPEPRSVTLYSSVLQDFKEVFGWGNRSVG